MAWWQDVLWSSAYVDRGLSGQKPGAPRAVRAAGLDSDSLICHYDILAKA